MKDYTEASPHLGITPRHLRRLVSERRIAFVKIGSRTLFRERDLDAFIDANVVEPVDANPLLAAVRPLRPTVRAARVRHE